MRHLCNVSFLITLVTVCYGDSSTVLPTFWNVTEGARVSVGYQSTETEFWIYDTSSLSGSTLTDNNYLRFSPQTILHCSNQFCNETIHSSLNLANCPVSAGPITVPYLTNNQGAILVNYTCSNENITVLEFCNILSLLFAHFVAGYHRNIFIVGCCPSFSTSQPNLNYRKRFCGHIYLGFTKIQGWRLC